MNRHFRRGDSTKWGSTSTGIRKKCAENRAALASRQYFLPTPDVRNPGSGHVAAIGTPDEYWFPGIARLLEPGKNRRVDPRKGGGVDLRSFMYDETGQGLVEYALIIAVIAVAVIVAMLFLQDQLTNVFTNIGNNLT